MDGEMDGWKNGQTTPNQYPFTFGGGLLHDELTLYNKNTRQQLADKGILATLHTERSYSIEFVIS